jgi:hypothetical protein
MNRYLPLEVLNFSHCDSCRSCCRFNNEELIDAPVFTVGQRDRILQDIEPAATFTERGELWQIRLEPIPDSDLYICPLYEPASARCRGYHLDIFDCRTWPLYAVHHEGRFCIAYSPTCPTLGRRSRSEIRDLAERALPSIAEKVRQFPDLVVPLRADLDPILDAGSWPFA